MGVCSLDARERVALAIAHRETDRIPTGEITIADEIIGTLLGLDGVTFPDRVEFVNHLGIDAVCESPEWPTATSRLPDPADASWNSIGAWATGTDRFVFAMLEGVFGWGTRLMGFNGFLTACLKGSKQLLDLIQGVERLNTDLAKRAAEAGANGILIADDIAHNQGTTVNPRALREFFFPSLRRQLDGIACSKIPVFFHSDGNLNAVIDDLVEIGFQGLQCIESGAGMDLAHLKGTYGKRLCLWGSFDPRDLFLERNAEELERRVRHIIDVAAPGGGFIFGTSSGLVGGMRPENLAVVYRVVGECGSSSRR